MWETAHFVFDANVLLHCYRYPPGARDDLIAAWEKLGDRIRIPHQAGVEFYRNRASVIDAARTAYSGIRNKWARAREQIRRDHVHTRHIELDALFDEVGSVIDKHLKRAEEQHGDDHANDQIGPRVEAAFEGKVLQAVCLDDQLRKEARKRCEDKVPPGFEDRDKKGDDAFGDFILWRELLGYAKSAGKSLIFVTDDAKEDWWWRVGGRTLGPRPELVKEMADFARVDFHMYDSASFLKHAGESLGADTVSVASVNEAEDHARREAERREKIRVLFETLRRQRATEAAYRALVSSSPGAQHFAELFRASTATDLARSMRLGDGLVDPPSYLAGSLGNIDSARSFEEAALEAARTEEILARFREREVARAPDEEE